VARRLAPFAVLAALVAGCGGKVVAPVAKTVVGTLATPPPTTTAPPAAAQYRNGDPVAGKKVFTSKGCTACHTLKDAGATGTVGPNLDQAKPSLDLVVFRVLNGKGAMPPFKGQLTTKQIADVAAYVVKATHSS